MRCALVVATFILVIGFARAGRAQEVRVTSSDGVSQTVTVPSLNVQSGVDYITPLFGTYLDYEPQAPSPCGSSSVVKTATPIVFDNTLMVLYVCTNAGSYENPGQRIVWRRYFRGTEPAPLPVKVMLPITIAPTLTTTPGTVAPWPVLHAVCDPPYTLVNGACIRR